MKAEKLDHSHLETRCEWLNSEAVFAHMNMQYPITAGETKDWFDRARQNAKRADFAFSDVRDVVAMTGLTGLDTENGLVEFYIMVGPGFQGKGYGLKATQWTINYAFLKYNVNKVYLYTNDFNERANNLYQKLGFELEGKLRQHKFKNGIYIDRCLYGLIKEDWKKQAYQTDQIKLEF